jgi:hypothetical protein
MAVYPSHELLGAPAGAYIPQQGSRHGWPFWVGITLLGVLLAAGVAAGAFFAGQGTRPSHAELTHSVNAKAASDRVFYTGKTTAALEAQRTHLMNVMKKRMNQAQQQGYSSGQSAGYSAGQSAGYSSGQVDGKKTGKRQGKREGAIQGYVQGFDEGTCYDPDTLAYVC